MEPRRARRSQDHAGRLGRGPGPGRRVPVGSRGAAEGGRARHRGAGPGRRGRPDLHRGRAGPSRRVRGAGRGGAGELRAVPRDPRRARLPAVHHRELAGRDRHHRRTGAGHLLQPRCRGHVRLLGGGDDRHAGRGSLSGRPGGGPERQAPARRGGPAAQLRERIPGQGRTARGDQRLDLGAARRERRGGRHPRPAQGHRGAAAARGAAPPVPEDGRDRPARGRHRARLQQPADRHRGARPDDPGAAAAGGADPPRRHARAHHRGPGRRAHPAAPGLQPQAGAAAAGARPERGDDRHGAHAEPAHRRGHRAGGGARSRGWTG